MTADNRVEKHRKQSYHYFDNAVRYLAVGDSEKASEFLWGSMAQALKALAASRGITLPSHNQLRWYAQGLAKELDDNGIYDVFREAQSLHSNFYETGLQVEDVATSMERTKKTIARIMSYIPEEN
jgi:hypothetical protein